MVVGWVFNMATDDVALAPRLFGEGGGGLGFRV